MKVVALTNKMSEKEWLEARKKGIGGSDAGTILGANRFKSAYRLYAERVGLVEDTFKGNKATEAGHALERAVAEMYAKETNACVVWWPVILQGEHEFMLANVDFFIVEQDEFGHFQPGKVSDHLSADVPVGIKAILEIKTSGITGRPSAEWNHNGVPKSYYWQGCHYAEVTQVHDVVFCCLLGGTGLVIRERHYEASTREMLVEAEARFWNQVQNHIEPDFVGAEDELEALKTLYPDSRGEVEIDQDVLDAVSDLRVAQDKLKRQEQEVNRLKAVLVSAIGEAEAASYRGVTFYTYRKTEPGESFDAKAFKEAEPELYAKFTKPRSGWRVLRMVGE